VKAGKVFVDSECLLCIANFDVNDLLRSPGSDQIIPAFSAVGRDIYLRDGGSAFLLVDVACSDSLLGVCGLAILIIGA
jgi:hypothetical protein